MKDGKQKIKSRILIPLGIALAILMTFSVFVVHTLHGDRVDHHADEHLFETKQIFASELDDDARLMGGLLDLLKTDENIHDLWLSKDREALLEYAKPIFESMRSKNRITHFYFHDVDSRCFLRVHSPLKYGDRIQRFSMTSAVNDGKVFSGIELGSMGTFTLRVISPWYIDGELVGYMELGEEIEHITPKISETLGVELCFVFDKSYLNQTKWEGGMRMMGREPKWDQFPEFVVSSSTIGELPDMVTDYMVEINSYKHTEDHFEKAEHHSNTLKMAMDNRHYHGRHLTLIDAAGRDVGDMVVLVNITNAVSEFHTSLMILTVNCIVISAILYGFFYFYIGQIEHRLAKSFAELQFSKAKTAQQQESLRAVFNAAPVAMMIIAKGAGIKGANNGIKKLSGKDESEIIGYQPGDVLDCVYCADGPKRCGHHPACDECLIRNTVKQVFETGVAVHNVESKAALSTENSEAILWLNVNAESVTIDDERNVILSLENISDRKRAEKELEKSEAFLNATGQMAKVGGWELGLEPLTLSWTEETKRIHEVPLDYVPDLDEAIKFYHPEDQLIIKKTVERAIEHGESFDTELRVVTGKGNHAWVQSIGKAHIENGKTVKISGTFQDITERKQAEEHLQSMNKVLEIRNNALDGSHRASVKLMEEAKQSEKELKIAKEKADEVNKELVAMQEQVTELNINLEKTVEDRTTYIQELLEQKNRFIRQLGHDLKTPLVPLIAGLPMVLESTKNKQNSVRISRCIDSVNYINNLVEKTLHFMHASSKDHDLVCEDIDLTKLAREITDGWQTALKGEDLKVVNNLSQPLSIFSDATAVREVIENIISNAVKYSDDAKSGKIRLDASKKGSNVALTITDTGIGIEPNELEHIFEEFHKVDPSRHDRTSIGLGLSICRGIMNKLNGNISIHSKGLGEGTEVTLEFPIKKTENATA